MPRASIERTAILIRCAAPLRRELEVLAEVNYCTVNQYCLRLLTDHAHKLSGNEDVLPYAPAIED